MNPVIKFTTLFGLLAVDLAVSMAAQSGPAVTYLLSAAFFAVSAALNVVAERRQPRPRRG